MYSAHFSYAHTLNLFPLEKILKMLTEILNYQSPYYQKHLWLGCVAQQCQNGGHGCHLDFFLNFSLRLSLLTLWHFANVFSLLGDILVVAWGPKWLVKSAMYLCPLCIPVSSLDIKKLVISSSELDFIWTQTESQQAKSPAGICCSGGCGNY